MPRRQPGSRRDDQRGRDHAADNSSPQMCASLQLGRGSLIAPPVNPRGPGRMAARPFIDPADSKSAQAILSAISVYHGYAATVSSRFGVSVAS